jgi:hypothetical protein
MVQRTVVCDDNQHGRNRAYWNSAADPAAARIRSTFKHTSRLSRRVTDSLISLRINGITFCRLGLGSQSGGYKSLARTRPRTTRPRTMKVMIMIKLITTRWGTRRRLGRHIPGGWSLIRGIREARHDMSSRN